MSWLAITFNYCPICGGHYTDSDLALDCYSQCQEEISNESNSERNQNGG